LQERIAGKLSVFCGHSGVGKTSLLRVLLGREIGRIGELSQATGKGRHTTTGAVLLEGPGCRVIDTPGIREFGVVGIEPEELRHYFPEFRELGCAVTDCLHEDEPGCVAQELPRYSSYRRVLTSLKEEYESRKPRSTKTKPGRKSLWR
jgi:ribosome biogenesis GTPase / thiamine phosphate phosphatase